MAVFSLNQTNRRAKGLLKSACPNTGVGNRRVPYTYQEHLNLNWHFANTDEFRTRYAPIFIPVKVGVAIYIQFGQEIELDLSRMEQKPKAHTLSRGKASIPLRRKPDSAVPFPVFR